jgi:hypothetical protein
MTMQPYDEHAGIALYQGDCRDVLAALEPESAQTISSIYRITKP